MNPKGTCQVCGTYAELIPVIYIDKTVHRCSECLNQPEDFSGTTEAHD